VPFVPFALPFSLAAGLLSVLLLGGGVYLLWAWYVGVVVGTGYLVSGIAILALTVAGRFIVLRFRPAGEDEPVMDRGSSTDRVMRYDGSEIHVELYGDPDAPPVVLTHGWGMNSTAWYYAKRQLAARFRLIVWDLPGLGESRGPDNHDYSLEKLARDLDAVLEFAGSQRAVIVGHSIGGMIALTWCRLFPDKQAHRLAGLVLANTTYTNPVQTTTGSGFFRGIQRPVLEPILHAIVWLSPVVWLMNWVSYFNGTAHLVSMLTGFAGSETRGQLDFATRFGVLGSPAVLARGVLGMFRYDASAALPQVSAPTLIVSGHLDRLTKPEASRWMLGQVPNAELEMLEPAGHVSTLEQYQGFATTVSAFVDRCQQHRTGAAVAEPLLLEPRSNGAERLSA
jgi:pimeloyl-ACP methyl ester carboxylesterase